MFTYLLLPGVPAVTGFPSVVNKPFASVFSNFSLLLLLFHMSNVAVAGIPSVVGLSVVVGVSAVDVISAVTNVGAVAMSSLLLLISSLKY